MLSPEAEQRVQEWLDSAPPLSEKQKDTIAAVFRGEMPAPDRDS